MGKEVGFLVASRLTGVEVLGRTGGIGECANSVGLRSSVGGVWVDGLPDGEESVDVATRIPSVASSCRLQLRNSRVMQPEDRIEGGVGDE